MLAFLNCVIGFNELKVVILMRASLYHLTCSIEMRKEYTKGKVDNGG